MCPAKWGEPECLLSDIEIVKVRLQPASSFFPFHVAHTRTICSLNGLILCFLVFFLIFIGVSM